MDGISNLIPDSFASTMKTAASRAGEGIPLDAAGNKTNSLGRGIDNFFRGVFEGMPGALPQALKSSGGMSGFPDEVGPSASKHSGKLLDDPRIAEHARRKATPKPKKKAELSPSFLKELKETLG